MRSYSNQGHCIPSRRAADREASSVAKPKRWAKPKAWATAIRAARAAAAVPLVDIAAAHKMSEPDMRRCLRGLPPRGRCAAVVAGVAAAQRPGPDDQTAAGHWACPPPAVRAVTADAAAVVTATARGSTSWGLKTRSVGSMPHVRLPRHTAVQFAADPAGHVRVQAANGDCPPGVLIRLSDDNNAQVQTWCAHNWGLPQSALRHLSVHPSADIRAGVANNPATPAYLVAVLAADPEPGVRSEAADNPACPPEALRDLVEDPETRIRQRVAERSDSAAALGGAAVTEVWESLASDNHYTRKQAAKHGDLAADTVARLAADPTWIVRFEIARRNDLDPVIVEQLASDHDWRVRRATAEREDLAADTVARLAVDDHMRVRVRIAAQSDLPAGLAQQLATDPDPRVRQETAARLDLDPDLRDRIVSDSDPKVSAAARRTARAANKKRSTSQVSGRT